MAAAALHRSNHSLVFVLASTRQLVELRRKIPHNDTNREYDVTNMES